MNEDTVIPLFAFCLHQYEAREHSGYERNAQINKNAFGDLTDADLDHAPREPKQRRQQCDEYPSVDAVEQNLKHTVESYQACRIFSVTSSELVPDDHHCNTACETDHDQADHVL